MDRADLERWTGRDVARLLALVENERRYYQELIARAPLGLALASNQGDILSSNRAARRLLRLSADQLRNRNIAELLNSPEIAAGLRVAREENRATLDLSARHGDQALRVSLQPVPAWSIDDECDILITLDVDVMRPAQEGPVYAETPAISWTLDTSNFQFTAAAGAFDQVLGQPGERWTGAPGFWLDRVAAEDRESVERFYREASAKPGVHACEFRAAGANGRRIWLRDCFRATEHGDAAVVLHGVTLDVTARRASEQDVIQANRVEVLTDLCRRLAHDFNNALMIAAGYGEELLTRLGDQDPRRGDVNALLTAIESMSDVTGEIQGFTRQQGAPPRPTDVREVLSAAGERIRQEFGSVLVVRVLDPCLTIVADAAQLEALLVAAARSLRGESDPHMIMTAGRAVVSEMIGLNGVLQPGEYAQITVRGPGTVEVPRTAFETVVSGRNAHAPDLARLYRVIREWGGGVRMTKTDHTSEIHLYVPCASEQTAPSPERESERVATEMADTAAAAGPPPVRAGTVLVVEDESGIRTLIHKILEREGFEVFEAGARSEALEVAGKYGARIGLLITDLQLGHDDGKLLAEELLASWPQMRVLYISGFTENPVHPMADAGLGSPYLQKPFTLASLMKKVRYAFEQCSACTVGLSGSGVEAGVGIRRRE